jgi:hypothetical protein
MSQVQGRYWQDGPAGGSPNGRVRAVDLPMVDAPPAEDTDLAAAVRATTRMRTAFYVVVLLIALGGQVSGAMEALGMPWYVALPAVGALELGGMVVLANADVRRRLGEHATLSRLLSAAIAGGAVAFNWLAHDNHLEGGFYGGMSLLGYLVWLMNTENKRRDRLRTKRQLPPTPPAYELVGHWLRHPLLTRRARSLAKAAPQLGLYGSLDAARAQVRAERRQAALAKVLRRKITRALDGTTADIAVAVYDLDEIARRLAERADYDGLTALIAADLAPARVFAGNLPAARRRRWGSRATRADAAAVASAGQLLNEVMSAPDHRSQTDSPDRSAASASAPAPASTSTSTSAAAPAPAPAPAATSAPAAASVDEPADLASAGQLAERSDQPARAADPAIAGQPPERSDPVLGSADADADPVPVAQVDELSDQVDELSDQVDERSDPTAGPAGLASAEDERSDLERAGRTDPVARPEPARPRWDALTAEVGALLLPPAPRRAGRSAPEREAAPARPASAEPEQASPLGGQSPVVPVGGQSPAVPLPERPLPDLVAAAATRTMSPAQATALPPVEPARPARGVAPVPAPAGEGSLRSRVYRALDQAVTADDDRDNPALTELLVDQLRLAPTDRTNVAKYVRGWRAEVVAGRRTPASERRLWAVPGQ